MVPRTIDELKQFFLASMRHADASHGRHAPKGLREAIEALPDTELLNAIDGSCECSGTCNYTSVAERLAFRDYIIANIRRQLAALPMPS
jgi:hypothetical protein